MDLVNLASTIVNGYGQFAKIWALSYQKFILTFSNKAQMEATLNNHKEDLGNVSLDVNNLVM